MPLELDAPPWWQWALLIPSVVALAYLIGRGLTPESSGLPRRRFQVLDFLVVAFATLLIHQLTLGSLLELTDIAVLPRGWRFGITVLVADAVVCAAALVFLRLAGHGPEALGLVPPRNPRNALATGLSCLAFLGPCWITQWAWVRLLAALGWKPTAQDALEIYVNALSANDRWEMAVMAAGAVVAAPLTEEIVFRGFIFGALRSWMRPWGAALLTSALFAAFHAHLEVLLPIFLIGLALNAVYLKTGCLAYPILFHALFNGTTLLSVSPRSGAGEG